MTKLDLDHLVIYPNAIPHLRGSELRGSLRSGVVEVNSETEAKGLAGRFVAVTHEADGYARCYAFALDECPTWHGPYMLKSEEVIS